MTQPFGEQTAQQNLAYELETAQQVVTPVDQQLNQFAQQAAAAYVALAGSLRQEQPEQNESLLRKILLFLLGGLLIRAAARLLGLIEQRGPISRELLQAIQQMDERANHHIQNAAYRATTGRLRNWDDVTRVVGDARRARNTVDQTSRWAANRVMGEQMRRAAQQTGMGLVWVAERNACLHCLAYAGEVAGPDGWFRGGLTFYVDREGRPKPLNTGPLWAPPLHPNCRCHPELWAGYDVDRFGPDAADLVDIPEVLKREAERAVLRGFSGYDSEPARLRAADVLLQRASRLGTSVQQRAREDIQAGQFISAGRIRRD